MLYWFWSHCLWPSGMWLVHALALQDLAGFLIVDEPADGCNYIGILRWHDGAED